MALMHCTIWIVLLVVIAGVVIWALGMFPLDGTVKQVGRTAIILLYVIAIVFTVLSCLGISGGAWPPVLK